MPLTRQNQKKIFLWCTAIFLVLILYASYDISRRTTFPGSKRQLEERIKDHFIVEDEQAEKEEKSAEEGVSPADSLEKTP